MSVAVRRATCSACRAFNPGRGSCELGYAQKAVKGQGYGHFSRKHPSEPCPRPLTIAALFAAPKRWELKP